ncbi:TonB-dependent receptor [Hephaestia sp. GCM10023244]|uniref:TonB-dependent receptor n=1 Tax=unclassified Hephaestia TaxID=2631281 RepID=UPI0020776F80|nr:TonB-dependent receptor [Hephaestia sp. MAHUQ-44]MCM8730616.1 TonB-dependent receptor [Hephaestia sp. MAHUQ-44]
MGDFLNLRRATRGTRGSATGAALRCGASLLVLGGAVAALPAWAQTTPVAQDGNSVDQQPAPGASEIVVTGIRESLANAQAIKRNADTVVDAITAQDIGALPDRSVTEALQRVPGVAINRFAGTNDPDHFSVEGSGVVVRGLNFVRSEFNGRDAFAAGVGGQALNFSDVPSELLGSVEVYKNVTAAMIEGGLAGTVNLNTRKPFDNRGFHVGFSGEANYGDFEKKWSPTGSLLVSDTWDTGIGTFGLLGHVSYSRLRSRADGIQVTNYQTRDNTAVPYQNGNGVLVCRNPLPGNSDTLGLPPQQLDAQGNVVNAPCGATQPAGADGFADFMPVAYAPIGGQFRSQDFDRKRDGVALAGQWESLDKSVVATAQFIRSHTTNSWGEHTFESAPDLSEYNTYPAGCLQNGNGPLYNNNGTTRAECPVGSLQNYQYDESGLFESGYITLPGTGWRTSNSGSADSFVPTGGIQQSLSRRQVKEANTVNDFGMNLKILPADRWEIQLDGDYTRSEHTILDVSTFGSTFADQELDLTGDLPIVIPHKPMTLAADWATPNAELASNTDAEYFANRNVQFWRAAMDHAEHSVGREYAFKADVGYDLGDDSFLKKLKVGARYADRDQTVRHSQYNWGVLSELWGGTPVSLAQSGSAQADFYDFQNFFRGQTPGPIGGYYYNGDLIKDYAGASSFLKGIASTWHNTNGAGAANDWEPLAERVDAIPGSMFRPNEIQRVKQQDVNAYLMVNFGGPETTLGNISLSGNAGVRFVHTDLYSFGASRIPNQGDLGITDVYDVRCRESVPAGAPPGTTARRPGGVCNLGPGGYALLQQFSGTDAAITPNQSRHGYTYWLPSLNLKFGLTNNLQVRFAASKVLTRPESSYVRSYLDLGVDGNGNLVANVGNPFLNPATAWQFDLTAEWYFSRVGSLTADVFYKDVKNFFYQATGALPITNNGITFPAQTRGPANYDGHGKIKGFEVAYQQTFDFLPGLLSGFGVNANYSYVQSSGLPNTFLNTGQAVNIGSIKPGNLPLEGLSKHNINGTIFYEKGPISLRAAYNWRSKFLLTAADVIFPYTSIFQDATGQLDASAFINVNKWIKLGVQGVNLTNEVTKTLQAYKGDPSALAPRSYFMNDRRFSFIIRGNF